MDAKKEPHPVAPALTRIAMLWDVKRSSDSGLTEPTMAAAARGLGLWLEHRDVTSANGFAVAFATARRDHAVAVLLIESPRAVANREIIAELGLKPSGCRS
jgi:hypothetical protein